MTKGQRALNDLEIVLDDALLGHDEMIQGWIGVIAAELAVNDTLVEALRVIAEDIDCPDPAEAANEMMRVARAAFALFTKQTLDEFKANRRLQGRLRKEKSA